MLYKNLFNIYDTIHDIAYKMLEIIGTNNRKKIFYRK